MRIVLESDEAASKEADVWFHSVVWGCFAWLQVLPSGIIRPEDGQSVCIPVRRPLVTGPGFHRLLGWLSGSAFTPSKMAFIPAKLIFRDVVSVDLMSVGQLPQGWVQLDAPISMDRANPDTVLIGMTSWPKREWMLKVRVKRMNVELTDNRE
jgi:hypothetical protein